VLPFIVKHRQE